MLSIRALWPNLRSQIENKNIEQDLDREQIIIYPSPVIYPSFMTQSQVSNRELNRAQDLHSKQIVLYPSPVIYPSLMTQSQVSKREQK